MFIQFDTLTEALAKVHEAVKKTQGTPGTPGSRALRHLVIHCTATVEGRKVTPEDIRRWHTAPVNRGGRGWAQVGYSDIVLLDGSLENIVPYDLDPEVDPWELTNGVKGINQVSRHIVYVGGIDKGLQRKDTRTAQQTASLKAYCEMAVRVWPDIKISGHYQHDKNKACPCFNVPAWLKSIGIPPQNIF